MVSPVPGLPTDSAGFYLFLQQPAILSQSPPALNRQTCLPQSQFSENKVRTRPKMDLLPEKGFFHRVCLLSLPSKHFLLLPPLLPSGPGGVHNAKKPKRTKAHRRMQWLSPA